MVWAGFAVCASVSSEDSYCLLRHKVILCLERGGGELTLSLRTLDALQTFVNLCLKKELVPSLCTIFTNVCNRHLFKSSGSCIRLEKRRQHVCPLNKSEKRIEKHDAFIDMFLTCTFFSIWCIYFFTGVAYTNQQEKNVIMLLWFNVLENYIFWHLCGCYFDT